MALFDAKNLRVHYGKFEALKGVSLTVEEGEIVALIGSNGAGKTTTLRGLFALEPLTSGEIWFRGEKVDGMPTKKLVRLGMGIVHEGRRLFPYMTVLENLKMGAFTRKDKDRIQRDIEEIYRRFPILKERRGQQAGTLSGGEQQMVATGRALMSKPKLLLMDEPSMGLTPILVQEVGRIITDLNKSGVSVILVEQNAHMALRIAHRGYVLEMGRVVLEGEARELLGNEYVKRIYLGG